MKTVIAGLSGEHYPPEQEKFKSALLLVHGVWSGPWCWQTWATHFCNLGWDCTAVDLRRRAVENPLGNPPDLSFSDCVRDLEEVIRSFSNPPVLVAMNLGALMALKALEKSTLAALVLVSPSPPGNLGAARSRTQRLLWLKYRLLLFLGRPFRIDEKDFRVHFLTPLPENLQIGLTRQTAPESTALAREFLAPSIGVEPAASSCPLLVLGGTHDRLTLAATGSRMAQWLGGEFREYPAQGHWLIEYDGESIVRDIHRWIIKMLGEKILLTQFS
ncbi:MAG TPA: alpha/beta hydrolase [Candidatus Binatia bacterium]|nr:alpha/beta hydrolase [Candidatus Binatia bacterium]